MKKYMIGFVIILSVLVGQDRYQFFLKSDDNLKLAGEENYKIIKTENNDAWLEARGKKYYYLGMSYGKECSYKKRFHGFEFWTGKEWKTNRKEYERMCLNDSKVKSFADLERLSDSYLYE